MAKMRNLHKKDDPARSTLDMVNAYIKEGITVCEAEHVRLEDNARFERGFQWTEGDAQRQEQRERPALPLNSLLKLVNAIANKEIMDRIVPRAYGREETDNGIAEALDEACRWQRDIAETEHEESMAFRKCVASGYGVMHKRWDPFGNDGDGYIADEEVPLWYMLWDPKSRKQNLVDRKWHLCGKYVDYEEAKNEFGEINPTASSFFSRRKVGAGFNVEQSRAPRPTSSNSAGTWGQLIGNRWFSSSGREIFIVEAEWKEVEEYFKVAYPVYFDEVAQVVTTEGYVGTFGTDEMGQPVQFSNEEFVQLDPQQQLDWIFQSLAETEMRKYKTFAEFRPFLRQYKDLLQTDFQNYRKEKRQVYKYAIVTDGVLLDEGIRPMGFTYEFLTGFPFDTREGMKWYGMIDVAKGPQDMKNVFFSNLLTIYMTSPKNHLMIEEGALNDPDQFLDEYAKTTGVSIVPNGFIASGRFAQMDAPRFPPMLKELIEVTESAVQETFGLSSIETNEQGDLRRISGNVVQAAKQASNTLLAILFDSLRRYRRRWGMLTVRFILEFYTPEDINSVIGMEKGQYIAGIKDWPEILKFDIKIDESPTSISDQMRTVDLLTRNGTIDNWLNQGFLDFEEAIDLLVEIPKSVRDKIKQKYLERKEEQNQVQQLQQQVTDLQQREQTLFKFIQSTQGGGLILAQYNMLQELAKQQVAEQQAQEQAQQQMGME